MKSDKWRINLKVSEELDEIDQELSNYYKDMRINKEKVIIENADNNPGDFFKYVNIYKTNNDGVSNLKYGDIFMSR